jgi:tetratricopeptide (TPR) repeat protein
MTIRFLTAASVLALVSACSSQPGPSGVSATDQGFSAFRAGNFAAAEQAYDTALSANPSNETAMLGLAEVYESTGRAGEAAALYARVHAARSGSIRVWNDGRAMQDGVTEVAGRRLGALGHGMDVQQAPISHSTITQFEAPAYVQPTTFVQPTTYVQPQATEYLPENPTYALDAEGIVYYADPEATQPIVEPVFEQPEMIKYAPAQPALLPAPMPAPVPVQSGVIYQNDAMAAPVEVVVPSQAAPLTYQPAPISYQPAPIAYQPTPAAISYEAAPAPVTTRYEPAPMVKPTAPTVSPTPIATRNTGATGPAQPLARSQPGYAVVNGDLVYISAEDIANGSTARSTQGPVGGEILNGIKIPNLN